MDAAGAERAIQCPPVKVTRALIAFGRRGGVRCGFLARWTEDALDLAQRCKSLWDASFSDTD